MSWYAVCRYAKCYCTEWRSTDIYFVHVEGVAELFDDSVLGPIL